MKEATHYLDLLWRATGRDGLCCFAIWIWWTYPGSIPSRKVSRYISLCRITFLMLQFQLVKGRSASVVQCKAYTILAFTIQATAAHSSYSLSARIAMVCRSIIDFATSCPTQCAPDRSLNLMEPRILIGHPTDITRPILDMKQWRTQIASMTHFACPTGRCLMQNAAAFPQTERLYPTNQYKSNGLTIEVIEMPVSYPQPSNSTINVVQWTELLAVPLCLE